MPHLLRGLKRVFRPIVGVTIHRDRADGSNKGQCAVVAKRIVAGHQEQDDECDGFHDGSFHSREEVTPWGLLSFVTGRVCRVYSRDSGGEVYSRINIYSMTRVTSLRLRGA